MNGCRSRALAAIAVLTLIALAIASAVSAPAAGSAAAQAVAQAGHGGVTFSYDTSLATDVQGRTVASNVGQGASAWEIRPEHIGFTFEGYPAKGLASPQIRVIPLAEYKSVQVGSSVSGELGTLESYLGENVDTPGLLPLLPPVNAQRIINEDVAPVAGAGVSGVRFVASYAQGIAPLTADNITYMFIGLTADRKYYVDAVFPVSLSTPLDPAPSPYTAESAHAYNQALAERLRNTDASGFTPSLDTLDKMIGSIRVNPTEIPGMPRTGAGISQNEGEIFALVALATMLAVAGLGAKRCSASVDTWLTSKGPSVT
jgi:hypothetical protein